MATSAGHDLTHRDHNREKSTAPSDPTVYAERIERLMASPGVSAWQALMRQNAERAKRRRDVA